MKFSELVTQSGHDAEHIATYSTLDDSAESLARIKRRPEIIQFAKTVTASMATIAVEEEGAAIEWVPVALQTDELCIKALNNDPLCFHLIKSDSDAVIDHALSLAGDNLMYVPLDERTQQRCIDAVTRHSSAIRYCPPDVFDA